MSFLTVYCNREDCIYNQAGKCDTTGIEINSDGLCETYEKENTQKGGNMEDKEVVTPQFLQEPMALGEIFMKSGLFKDLTGQAEAAVKVLAGRELGLTPLESMGGIYMVNGKVALQSKLIAALIRRSKKYDYVIDVLTNEECAITFYKLTPEGQQGAKLGQSIFTIKDAALAGIINKQVWKNFPKNMLYARAITNGARFFTPDAYCGFSTEEMEEIGEIPVNTKTISITTEGEVINETTKTPVP